MCVHKTPCRSLFISFVSFSFNKRHVSVPTRTSIRAIGAIRVKKKYSCHSHYYLPSICGPTANLVFKISCSSCERTAANKDSWGRWDPYANKNIRVIRVIRVQKIQYEIRVPHKYIRVIPKATLDFFMGFFDMIVAGRTDYALMTEALLVKPV